MPTTRSADKAQKSATSSSREPGRSHCGGELTVVGNDARSFLKQCINEADMPTPVCPRPEKGVFKMPSNNDDNYGHSLTDTITNGLKTLVQSFPREKHIAFGSKHGQRIPLQLGVPGCQCVGSPSIIATLPLYPVLPVIAGATWWDISIFVDVNTAETDDPIAKSRSSHAATLQHIEESANCMMVAQGRLFVFAIGVYGRLARIYRFDRAGIMASPAFEYAEHPEILHEFLWRFLNPFEYGCIVVGSDPTIRELTDGEYSWAHGGVRQYEKDEERDGKFIERQDVCRWFSFRNGEGRRIEYLGYKIVSASVDHVFGRGVVVWKALSKGEKRVIIKDVWRSVSKPSEMSLYDDVQAYYQQMQADDWEGDIPLLRVPGLALMARGESLGEAEERLRRPGPRATRTGPAILTDMSHRDLGLPTGHQTMTARLIGKDDWRDHEKDHDRLVIETVGTPLTHFGRTKELVEAFRDAILGHKYAFEAGVIHGDVSERNILLDQEKFADVKGFLHDLANGFNWKRFLQSRGWTNDIESWIQFVETGKGIVSEDGEQTGRRRRTPRPKDDSAPGYGCAHRTGTYEFCSVNSLQEQATGSPPRSGWVRDESDDLEAFYWVLVWVLISLRLSTIRHNLGQVELRTLFPAHPQHRAAFNIKLRWLKANNIRVVQERQLNTLLNEFRALCYRNVICFASDAQPRIPLTHDAVLEIFNQALETDGWPERPPKPDDKSVQRTAGRTRVEGQAQVQRDQEQIIPQANVHARDDGGKRQTRRARMASNV
ncbi:uncharacterized protein C8Q71DRAFT_862381 [Rhodofomes roseus]|uniref:Fungal-type protein kinase domain-containing protein n=1 Tax=Rhodofomes roseus TaxID=34475 RepID=A0ABQ8K2B0_9APHY|nr:uncharacterized protein C8Q71DRAFT_862381 [Rhodofomes roseus]KAH9830628.1 hypothetical protein C8Q71DRAFT_862381 [Rhodofomes roseus]